MSGVSLSELRREMDRLKTHIEAVYDQAAVLSQMIFHMEQQQQEPPKQQQRSDCVFVENIHRQDIEVLKEKFRLSYGERLIEFTLYPSGRSARVRFTDEASQKRCLEDAAAWNRDYRIKVHPYVENWRKRSRTDEK